jgi:outer membrane protein insertion porin family
MQRIFSPFVLLALVTKDSPKTVKSSTEFLMMRSSTGAFAATGLMLAWSTFASAATTNSPAAKPATSKTTTDKTTAGKTGKSAPAKTAVNATKDTSKTAPKLTTAKAADAPRTQISTGSRKGSEPSSASVAQVEWHGVASKTPAKTEAASTPVEVKTDGGGPDVVIGSRVAQTPQTDANKPAATPDENQPGLVINPVEGDQPKGDQPDAVKPPAPTITPSPSTPAPTPDENALSAADAEGREIAAVRVVGNRVVSEDTVLLQIAGIKPGAAFSSRQAELDRRHVRDLGFFATVDYQVVPNLQDPNKVDVIFVVVENRVVTGFRFEGAKELSAEQMKELQAIVVSKPGAVLSSTNVDADVKAIQEYYRKQGFAALVTDVRQEEDGTVVYAIQEGTISRIELSGLKKTKPSIVRSVIFSKSGDPFNEEKIQKDLNRIYDLGFFEDVSYKVADDPQTPGALIVTLTLKEKRTGSINFGVGFDSRSKISGFAGLSESNFKGTGKTVSAQVELGSQRSFNLGFGDRFVGEKNASYNINVFSQTFFREPRSVERLFGGGTSDDDDRRFSYQERRQGLRFNYQQPLDFERTRNILYGYRFEKARLELVDNDSGGVPLNLPVDASGRTSALSIGFLRDRRDLKLDPSRGGRELLTLEEGLKALGGTSTFTKADLDIRRYYPLIGSSKRGQQPRLVLAGRIIVGQTFGQLPAFEQYFIGGSDTVRGYDADEQFGDNQIFGNLEFRFRLQKKIQLVAFADAGSAYGGSFASSDGPDALFGVGVGARLQTPIGPVRLDIAQGSNGIKTHFGIGATF